MLRLRGRCASRRISARSELRDVKSGKLSPEALQRLVLGKLGARRTDVLVHAAFGEDAAVVDFGSECCVLSADPITAAGERAGWLGVHIACNDVAAMGATPVGVLATILVPALADEAQIARLMDDMHSAAAQLGIEILGGHTEVTPGVTSSILSMTAVGRAPRARIVRSSGAEPGNALVLTKWAGLEGTAILASDLEERLAPIVSAETLAAARQCIELVSVVPEGLLAAELGATAMHDPTEGGVLGALWELAEASHRGFELEADAVPLRPETRAVCTALHVDPLRLISSGALLVACPDGEAMAEGLQTQSIAATVIGRVTTTERVVIQQGNRIAAEPVWRDELWRLLESNQPQA
jgi:hydrogenase expression/formation protein HypE